MGTVRKFGLVSGAWLLVAAAGPAQADGLGKFNDLIKSKIPPDALSYKSAKALGDSGFVLEDVVITPPPDVGSSTKPEPIKIHSLTVEDVDFDSIAKQAPPNFLRAHLEGLEVSKNSAAGIDFGDLGDKVTADFQIDYRLDPAKKTLTLSRLEMNLNGLARLEMSTTLDGVSVDDVAQLDKAMNDASLRTASLVYDDHSLLGKVVPLAAKMMGSDPDASIKMATGVLDGLRAGQSAATQAVIDSLDSYVEDYKAPKGPLRVTLNPPGKVSAATVTGAAGPDDVIKALGIKVEYAGTRKQDPSPKDVQKDGDKGGDSDAQKK